MFLDEDAGSEYAKELDHNGIQVDLPQPSLPPEIESIINAMQTEWLKMQPPTLDPAIETILAELQTAWQTNQAETTKTIAQTWSEVDAEWETMLNEVKTENMCFEFDVKKRLAELKIAEFDIDLDPEFDPLDLLEIEVEEPITEADNDTSDGMPITVNLAELLKGKAKVPEFDWSIDDLAPEFDSFAGGPDDHFCTWDTGEFPALKLGFAGERPTDNNTPTPWAYETPLPLTATRPMSAVLEAFHKDKEDTLYFGAGEFPSGNTPVPPPTSGTSTRLSPDLSAYYQLAAERLGERPPKPTMTNSTPALFSKPPTIGDRSLASRAEEGAKALWGKVRSWF